MIARFADAERGGFFATSTDHEQLVARRKEVDDHPIPAGNSSAAYGLLRLAALTGEDEYERRPRACFACSTRSPSATQAFAHLLRALDFRLAQTKEVALAGGIFPPIGRDVERSLR